jgi:hypothetical protein
MFASLFITHHSHNSNRRVFGKIADELTKRQEDRERRLKKRAGRFRQFLRDLFRKGEDEAELKKLKGEMEDAFKRFRVHPLFNIFD